MTEKLHRIGQHGIPHRLGHGCLDAFLADDLVQKHQGLRPAAQRALGASHPSRRRAIAGQKRAVYGSGNHGLGF